MKIYRKLKTWAFLKLHNCPIYKHPPLGKHWNLSEHHQLADSNIDKDPPFTLCCRLENPRFWTSANLISGSPGLKPRATRHTWIFVRFINEVATSLQGLAHHKAPTHCLGPVVSFLVFPPDNGRGAKRSRVLPIQSKKNTVKKFHHESTSSISQVAQLKSPWSLALCSSSSLYTPPSCSLGQCPLQPGSWARSMARRGLGPRPGAPRGGPLPRRATNGPLWSSSNPAGWYGLKLYGWPWPENKRKYIMKIMTCRDSTSSRYYHTYLAFIMLLQSMIFRIGELPSNRSRMVTPWKSYNLITYWMAHTRSWYQY